MGENRRVAFEALLVGLAIVILNLAASLLAQFVFFPALSYDTTLFGLLPWVSPVFTRLVPFFLIFYIAERERIDPFLRWYETVASLFLGGVVIGMILPIVEPIAEQYVFSLRYPQGSFSFQFLKLQSWLLRSRGCAANLRARRGLALIVRCTRSHRRQEGAKVSSDELSSSTVK